jgi:membrane protease YdiL (CAAX protease family)
MDLDELKKSMSTLDDVLAQKSGDAITLNTDTCSTAQKRIMKRFRQGASSCAIIAVVTLIVWNAGVTNDSFPLAYRLYLGAFLAVAAIWYAFLYFKTKKINIALSTPMQTMRQVSSLRLYTLVGEIVLVMAMVVFFTLFLSNLWVVAQYRFWIVISAIVIFMALFVTVYLPRIIRDFKNLTDMR